MGHEVNHDRQIIMNRCRQGHISHGFSQAIKRNVWHSFNWFIAGQREEGAERFFVRIQVIRKVWV